MEWEGREESENVEDRRGMGRKAGIAIAGGGGLVVVIIALLLGVDPQKLLDKGMPGGPPVGQRDDGPGPKKPADPAEEKMAHFTKIIFGDTERVWDEQFRKMGRRYEKPVLVLFSDQVDSACGSADSAVGPFYCPGDHRVYIDLSFYRDMERKLNAPGEFARAYVIAHEVGHHVQNLLGYSKKGNDKHMSVRLELQADYLAGVWAHHGQEKYKFLDKGDIETALNAAFEIGDDRLQKKARGYVVPDSFTHGTSQQRMKWFMDGFKTGDIDRARLLFELPYDKL
jgi:predicted metalloprotease